MPVIKDTYKINPWDGPFIQALLRGMKKRYYEIVAAALRSLKND